MPTRAAVSRGRYTWTDTLFFTLALGAMLVLLVQVFGTTSAPDERVLAANQESKYLLSQDATPYLDGKLALVSVHPDAYIVRNDGQRFDVGSSLPNGAVLTAVSLERLTLQKHEQTVTITLP